MTTKHRAGPRHRPLRRPVLLAIVALLLGLGLVPLTAAPAVACTCDRSADEELARGADAVFVGRVDEAAIGSTSASVVVDEVYKGDVRTYTDVVVANAVPGCGVDFVRGETMVLFAQDRPEGPGKDALDRLTVNLCDGTRVLGSGPLALAAPGHAPIAGSSTPAEPGLPVLGWLSFVAVAGLGLLPVALWLRLRSRLLTDQRALRVRGPGGSRG